MRHATGLPSPHPIGETLPGLFRADPFTQGLCTGLDEVLAPEIEVLDNLPAYFDLATTPDDMLPWLATWVGMVLDPGQRPARQRELLRAAAKLHGWQGTARGVQLAVEAFFGLPVEVLESGATAWAADPGEPLPGEPVPTLVVQVTVGPGQTLDRTRLEALVAAVTPAHVLHRVQVVDPPS